MTPDELRDRIAAVLRDWGGLPPEACLPPVQRDAVADAVLPVVRKAIAAELDEAADRVESEHAVRNVLGEGTTLLRVLLAVEDDLRNCAARWRQP